MVPLGVGNKMAELIKNSKTNVIQNCGHMIIFEKAFEMRKLVKEFLIENKKMKKYFIAKSRRLRSTPYSSRIEKQGVTAYTVYNHMLLPAGFGSLEDSYFHLKENVQVWDVAAERQVEISGKDSAKLVQLMTCRDLSKSKIGRCYYCPIIDDKAGLINDPVDIKT